MSRWSNDAIEPARQFDVWRDRLREGQNPAAARRTGAGDDPFPASITIERLGSYDILTVEAPPHWVELRARDVVAANSYFVLRPLAPATVITPRNRTDTQPGDILLINPARTEALESADGVRYRALTIPRRVLDPYLPPRRWTDSVMIFRPGDPVGALVCGYGNAMLADAARLPSQHADGVVDTFSRLAGMAAAGGGMPDTSAVRAARLAEARRMVVARLSDPGLSPARVAASLRMSTRNLHGLFQDTGQTFSGFVTARRLDACARLLADPDCAGRSVTDIAFACGFNNLTTFYRAFRSKFQMTPNEMRLAAIASLSVNPLPSA